jgi:hypothetical protein
MAAGIGHAEQAYFNAGRYKHPRTQGFATAECRVIKSAPLGQLGARPRCDLGLAVNTAAAARN